MLETRRIVQRGRRKNSRSVVFLSVGWGQKYRFLLAAGWDVPEVGLSRSTPRILMIRRVWASRAIGELHASRLD